MRENIFVRRPALSYLKFTHEYMQNKNINTVYFLEQIFLIASIVGLLYCISNYENMNLTMSKGIFIMLLLVQLLAMFAEVIEIARVMKKRLYDMALVAYFSIYLVVFMVLVYMSVFI